jgi:hypothetical protein
MAGFGFSTSKQSSQYTSQDQASALARNFASSLDTSVSRSDSSSLSRGSSESVSGGQATSTQNIAFEDLLRSLYGNATDAASAQVANSGLFEGEAQQLFTGGLGFLDQLQRPAGTDYLEARVTGPDAAADAQIGALGSSLGRFFNEQLAPGITSRGVSTGTLGGSRQSVSLGKAAGEVGERFSTGVAQILANSQAGRDAAAGMLSSNSINAAGTGLSALPSVLGLAGAGLNAGLSPYLSLSQILGAPTVLTQGQSSQASQSSSQQIAEAISAALASSFGMSNAEGFSESQSSSYSQGTSKGKSLGFSFGVGGGAAG